MLRESEQRDAANLLVAWRECPDSVQAAGLLDQLFERFVQPWLADISTRTIHSLGQRESDLKDQAAEIRAEVALGLTAQLAIIREKNFPPIRDLRAYLASAIYNASFMRIRARAPNRVQLHNRLRYLLRNDSRYAIWESEHGLLAGLAQWSGQNRTAPLPSLHFVPVSLAEFVEKVFHDTAAPVTWRALASLAADRMGVDDRAAEALKTAHEIAAPERRLDAEIDGRLRLAKIWAVVLELPVLQRVALLLNLRDPSGQGVVELLPATEVASFAELARALAMTPMQLAGIWNRLPLEDAVIARQLGVTRQQVINLRKSARARISRRVDAINIINAIEGNKDVNLASNSAGRSFRVAREVVKLIFGSGGERPNPEGTVRRQENNARRPSQL